MAERAWLWWSSGKDSAWALHELRRDPNVRVEALVTTVNAQFDRVAMHAVPAALLRRQAEAAGLPLRIVEIPHPCPNEEYERAVGELLLQARDEGIDAMAFGDLHLQDVRRYREELLAGSSITPLFPLWGRDTAELAGEMIAGGLRAVVTCVDPRRLPAAFAGRTFDAAFLDELPTDVDPCGENGEFHTFVTEGPMLTEPLRVSVGCIVEREGFVFADVVAA